MYRARNGRTYRYKETRSQYNRRRYGTAHPVRDTIIGLLILGALFS